MRFRVAEPDVAPRRRHAGQRQVTIPGREVDHAVDRQHGEQVLEEAEEWLIQVKGDEVIVEDPVPALLATPPASRVLLLLALVLEVHLAAARHPWPPGPRPPPSAVDFMRQHFSRGSTMTFPDDVSTG
jgi:hypothetical protein